MRFKPFVYAVVCTLLPGGALANPVPALHLASLIDSSDLIIIGTVESITEHGRIVVNIQGRDIPADVRRASVRADTILKGALDGLTVRVSYVAPTAPTGYVGITPGTYRLLFLRQRAGEYEFASPYYPSFMAVPLARVEGGSAADRVVNAIGAVVEAASIERRDKISAIHALSTGNSEVVRQTLRKALKSPDESVRLSAAAALLVLNDLVALPIAEDALQERREAVNGAIAHNLRYGISEMRSPAAVPALLRLLKSTDHRTRRAAASSLRRSGSAAATTAWFAALDDSDQEVRYYAVTALAELTGEAAWRPDIDTFRKSEAKYLSFWKERAKRQN